MKAEPLKPEHYLYLKEKGIDIDACVIDYQKISVRCGDLSNYRKAFRVKIRALLKRNNQELLKQYIHHFYVLAQFVRYLYGYHSCSVEVQPWQEELASYLQMKFSQDDVKVYDKESWMTYESRDYYCDAFKKQYATLTPHMDVKNLECLQDGKPFLNPKDRAHFDKCSL